jgi:hypothetical protein
MNEVFEEIAKHENCEFKTHAEKYAILNGTRIFVYHYFLKIEYENHFINITSELGNHNIGKIEMAIIPTENISEFLITSRSLYVRLFNKKLNILKVECRDSRFNKYLQGLLFSTNLENLARENRFEPQISFSLNQNKGMLLTTDYHLEFNNKKDVLLSLIKFYKAIVTHL